MKTCTKCKDAKPLAEFSKRASTPDGLQYMCRECAKANYAAYCAANPEKEKARKAAYRAANPEKVKTSSAAYRAANPDKVKARNATLYAENPEKAKARIAAWRAANPEKMKASSAAYCAANTEKRKVSIAAWQAANPEKRKAGVAAWQAANPEARRIHRQNRRARKLESGGKLSPGLSARLFKLQRGKCPCCGLPLGSDFHLDHVIPLALGGSNSDANMQLLRATCNHQKSTKHPIDFMQSRGFLL